MGKNFFILCVAMLIFLTTVGCGSKSSKRTYLRENVDLGFIERIAVVPFENNTKDEFASERARNATITHVLARGLFDVADSGLVDSALQEEAIEPGTPLDLNSLKRLGQRLNVQAFILGAVDESSIARTGSYAYPEFSLTLRLVEANAAVVLWQSNGHRSGNTYMGRLFGLTPDDTYQLTDKLVKEQLKTLPTK